MTYECGEQDLNPAAAAETKAFDGSGGDKRLGESALKSASRRGLPASGARVCAGDASHADDQVAELRITKPHDPPVVPEGCDDSGERIHLSPKEARLCIRALRFTSIESITRRNRRRCHGLARLLEHQLGALAPGEVAASPQDDPDAPPEVPAPLLGLVERPVELEPAPPRGQLAAQLKRFHEEGALAIYRASRLPQPEEVLELEKLERKLGATRARLRALLDEWRASVANLRSWGPACVEETTVAEAVEAGAAAVSSCAGELEAVLAELEGAS